MSTSNTDDSGAMPRRDFFRLLSLGGMGAAAGMLGHRAWRYNCIGDGLCRKCLSTKECELPPAVEFRADQQQLKDNHRRRNVAQAGAAVRARRDGSVRTAIAAQQQEGSRDG
jgi:hypothetical protein